MRFSNEKRVSECENVEHSDDAEMEHDVDDDFM